VRVIAGTLGGRRLVAPRGSGTRPTSDRVREALFMALEPLQGLRVVDLFAGSGALGIEALSRGASHADFVEARSAARRVLASNIATLGIAQCSTTWALELPQGLRLIKGPLRSADLILLDPPYGGDLARATLEALDALKVVKRGARVIVEHHAKDVLGPAIGSLRQVRERKYGETAVTHYEASALEAEEDR
jgi:16S rRNA (guanine966-N2)-methyltransferase